MQKTAISWTNFSWNPISGCSVVSDGCKNCYAATMSAKYGWTSKPWTLQNEEENVQIKPHKLIEAYTQLKEPQRVFVNSMSDMFHRVIPDWYRAAVFCVMLDLPQHIFQVLTKRANLTIDWHERFTAALQTPEFKAVADSPEMLKAKNKRVRAALERGLRGEFLSPWGAHIWMGTSVEDARVLHRIDDLRKCRAEVRFISAEPLIGPWGEGVNLEGIHWVIVGGESGQHMTSPDNPRWMKQEWAREIKRLCLDQGVAYFFKQDSGYKTELRTYLVEEDGSRWVWQQYPKDLRPPTPYVEDGTFAMPAPDGQSLEYCLAQAHACEQRAYTAVDAPMVEHHAMTAAYWYEAAQKLRPQRPVEVSPSPTSYAAYEVGEFPDYDWGSTPRQVFIANPPQYVRYEVDEKVFTLPGRQEAVIRVVYGDDRYQVWDGTGLTTLHAQWLLKNPLPVFPPLSPTISAATPEQALIEVASAPQPPSPAPEASKVDNSETEWVKQVNAEARRLDQEWDANAPRKRANAVAQGLLPEAGERALTELMRPEMDAFVNLASGGTHTTVESLLDAVKPITRVVNFRNILEDWNPSKAGWNDPAYVYIGRASVHYGLKESPFANPFKITSDTPENRAKVISEYREYITRRLEAEPKLRQQLEALRGKKLVCWCKDAKNSKPCHGDVLVELLGESPTVPDKKPEAVPVNEGDKKQDKPTDNPVVEIETEPVQEVQPSLFGDDAMDQLERTKQLALLF